LLSKILQKKEQIALYEPEDTVRKAKSLRILYINRRLIALISQTAALNVPGVAKLSNTYTDKFAMLLCQKKAQGHLWD